MKIRRSKAQLDDLIKATGKYFKEHISYNIRFVVTNLFTFTLMFHIMACIWIIIGSCNTPDTLIDCYQEQDGWVKVDFGSDYGLGEIPSHLQNNYLYITAFYFITTTASTIGYGDYGAKSTMEMFYVIIVQFIGMSVFSIISGAYKEII